MNQRDFYSWMGKTFRRERGRLTVNVNSMPTQLRHDQVAALIVHLAEHLQSVPVIELPETEQERPEC